MAFNCVSSHVPTWLGSISGMLTEPVALLFTGVNEMNNRSVLSFASLIASRTAMRSALVLVSGQPLKQIRLCLRLVSVEEIGVDSSPAC